MFSKLAFAVNIAYLVWFFWLQLVRYSNTGRACAGDFTSGIKIADKYERVLLSSEATWYTSFVLMQYLAFFTSRFAALVISNNLEAEMENLKAK